MRPMNKRVRAFFSGTVQGVGFRYATVNVARGFNVTGWVRNRSDGRVEVLAEGLEKELESFIQGVEDDMGGYIRHKTVLWEEATGEWRTFGIGPTQ